MDAVAAFFERFNARKLDEMADLFGSGYTYAEPMFPEPRDAAGHVAHMRQILETYPDRQMRVRRCVPGPNGEMVEAEWSGTRAGSGIIMTLHCFFAVDVDPKSGGSTGDLADSTVAYSVSATWASLAREPVASGGVIDRGEQDVYVAVVDAGDGVAQADGCPVGEAGGEAEHPAFPG